MLEFCRLPKEYLLCSLVSVQKLEHPAVCLPSLKGERTLVMGCNQNLRETSVDVN